MAMAGRTSFIVQAMACWRSIRPRDLPRPRDRVWIFRAGNPNPIPWPPIGKWRWPAGLLLLCRQWRAGDQYDHGIYRGQGIGFGFPVREIQTRSLGLRSVNGDGRPDFFYCAGNGVLAINTTTGFTEAKGSGLDFPCGKSKPDPLASDR